MKTSTMLLIAAFLVVLGCLTAFNIDLKKAYATGEYRSRFKDMTFTALKGIDKLDIQNINLLGVSIEQGDKEGIWINEEAAPQVKFHAAGNQLTVLISDEDLRESNYFNQGVIIITKDLQSLLTRTRTSKHADKNFFRQSVQTSISGFHTQHLTVGVSSLANLSFKKIQVDSFNAVIGTDPKGQAALELQSDIRIGNAVFNVPGRSTLSLLNPDITKAVYHLSDSATVTLKGKLTRFVK